MPDTIHVLEELIEQVHKLEVGNFVQAKRLVERTGMVIRLIKLPYIEKLAEVRFDEDYFRFEGAIEGMMNERIWVTDKESLLSILDDMRIELLLSQSDANNETVISENKKKNNSIFIVHGHDEAMKLAVARTVEKLGLEPIILHEQPNKGLTIIEKFEDYSDAGFAIVLLSPDDKGFAKDSAPKSAIPRARQNVIFELGYFIGKLGRERVAALYQEGIEMPSDYDGVLYTKYDDANGNWRFELVRELKVCGYDVSADKLL